jgi:hypothetical protein
MAGDTTRVLLTTIILKVPNNNVLEILGDDAENIPNVVAFWKRYNKN